MGQNYSHSVKRKPPSPYQGEEPCAYGCGQVATWQFNSGKLCCSESYNSCPEKRRKFSQEVDHKIYSAKSLETRTRFGITKTSQIKATKTRIANGDYEKAAEGSRKRWRENPYTNNRSQPLSDFKGTGTIYQGSYEYLFLERLEAINGLDWISERVRRGPTIWYEFEGKNRMYLPDFLIGNTIYEIKSGWTWDHAGTDQNLLARNISKLNAALQTGYSVILVKDHIEEEFNVSS